MYVGREPWHGLGQELDHPATAEEAISAASLDWEVAKQPLYAGGEGFAYRVDGKFAVVPAHRWGSEECPVLGIVGADYTPLQNRDAFRFFDPIVGKGAASYHTAGALGDGERIWILAKLEGSIKVTAQDISHKYLLLSNSHDGESSVQIKFTPIRVACWNTLTMALSKGPTIRVAHTQDLNKRLENARSALRLIDEHYKRIEESFKAMAAIRMTPIRLEEYFAVVFPDPSDVSEKQGRRRAAQNRENAAYLYEHGKGNNLPGVAGTLWAAYNGITEFVDHKATRRTPKEHLESIWFGDGYQLKARAFEVAKGQIDVWLR
jgi:phage/plasmid-like protein (TIGR03299 family)